MYARLTSPEELPNRFRKLRLQDGDEEEYRETIPSRSSRSSTRRHGR